MTRSGFSARMPLMLAAEKPETRGTRRNALDGGAYALTATIRSAAPMRHRISADSALRQMMREGDTDGRDINRFAVSNAGCNPQSQTASGSSPTQTLFANCECCRCQISNPEGNDETGSVRTDRCWNLV